MRDLSKFPVKELSKFCCNKTEQTMLQFDIRSYYQFPALFSCSMLILCILQYFSDYSDVFATASKNEVRVWSVSKSRELLRISVPNFTCSSLIFTHDGKSIVTGKCGCFGGDEEMEMKILNYHFRQGGTMEPSEDSHHKAESPSTP